uniref:Outer dense fiber of sperm tails 2 like n=1 Tax=Salvator merianae TaxID=96440 RepID=A0A8D0DVL1_SALMN
MSRTAIQAITTSKENIFAQAIVRLIEEAVNDEIAFREQLYEAELAIGSAEMFLPLFKETLDRISKACYISASDMVKISIQDDLLVKELEVLKNMKRLLQQLLRTSKEREIIGEQIEDSIQKLTERETEAAVLKNEVIQKERYILELSLVFEKEKANVLKASRRSESVQSVQTHLQCQIQRKEAENNQLRTKLETIEKKITEWKLQSGECKQQILAEKERREERRKGLKRAASVQKQRAEHLKATVESLISKIREKEIQLSEVLSACNVWKSHHETVVDEKTRLEVQAEALKRQIAEHVMELKRIQENGRKSKNEILRQLKSVSSENERLSLENGKLKVKKLEMEAEELKTRYEKVIHESKKLTEDKDLERDEMRGQTEARLKELKHSRDLQRTAEEKLQKCQESLLTCQKSCVDKSRTLRELQAQVGDNDGFLKQLSLEEENRNIQIKFDEVERKLEEMELKNKELENQLANQEECLQKTELQFKEKVADCSSLARQLEAALEDGRKKLSEEVEKITSKEQLFKVKILDLENELRRKKEEQKRLSKSLDTKEKHQEMALKELEHSLQRSENQNQSIQNYVTFLKTSYVKTVQFAFQRILE